MKSIIAMSLAGLIGLCATESHAEDAMRLRCHVKACINADTRYERCEDDNKQRALVTDFGNQFAVKYETPATTMSPVLNVRQDGSSMAHFINGEKRFVFWRRGDGMAYAIIRASQQTAFIFSNCEVIN
ncbi:hypothetical protein DIBBI_gp51 [Xanthomonas phage vB_XveM_DIBBI]|uniref:Uncharacterized protein n=1 Tax=Xanthomonas phage vB_XveM_DIBBI TaxID=1129194 RepID=I3PGY4_9CAUD|nr:hypothetical protein DIBBI_gp51 [Xanthomonas phage vB_XveM_DIBBI]AEX65719.1 hypothetical protein DIBBI_051 [Xanthomonas phage vB_XveM_DIBBI]